MQDEQRDIASLMSQVCKDIVSPYVQQKEFIFIDIETLYDFKLGALLGLTNEKEYKYILGQLPTYLASKDLEISKYFPDINISEETIAKYMADPLYNKMLSLTAPPRSIVEDLEEIITGINTYNSSRETQRPLKITINQSTFVLAEEAKIRLVNYIQSIDSTVEVYFTEHTWSDIPKDLLAKQDILIVYDIASFVDIGSKPIIDCIRESLLANTVIATFMQVTNPNCTDAEKGELNFAALMNIFCNNFIILEKELLVRR